MAIAESAFADQARRVMQQKSAVRKAVGDLMDLQIDQVKARKIATELMRLQPNIRTGKMKQDIVRSVVGQKSIGQQQLIDALKDANMFPYNQTAEQALLNAPANLKDVTEREVANMSSARLSQLK